jgi:hypothetical protein
LIEPARVVDDVVPAGDDGVAVAFVFVDAGDPEPVRVPWRAE